MSVELIAEVATNHGGNLALAKEFIWRFAEAGADWIKFQHTRVKHLRLDDPQYEWFKSAELSLEQFQELKAECEKAGAKFLTTVYNHQDVPEVQQLELEAIKIGSGEATECELACAVMAGAWPRIIVGCGLHNPFAGQTPYRARFELNPRTVFLFCFTRYPCPAWLATCPMSGYGLGAYTGWSDHCLGLDGSRAAIMAGATIIEKHVQLPNQARPCKSFEATVEEFKQLRAFADEDPTRFLGRWQHA